MTKSDPAFRVIERAFAAVAALREREHAADFSEAARENVRELIQSAYLSKPHEAKRAFARLVIACNLDLLTVRDLEKIAEMGRTLVAYPPIGGPALPWSKRLS